VVPGLVHQTGAVAPASGDASDPSTEDPGDRSSPANATQKDVEFFCSFGLSLATLCSKVKAKQ